MALIRNSGNDVYLQLEYSLDDIGTFFSLQYRV